MKTSLDTEPGELATWVIQAQRGPTTNAEAARLHAHAYTQLVQRFQDMAVGYAYALLGDYALAEDAAQESFLSAYLALPTLREPAAFPGWFRRIVFTQADRVRRKRAAGSALSVTWDETTQLPAQDTSPAETVERREQQQRIWQAIAELPESQRQVIALFYFGERSLNEISTFLETPVGTVKTQLHAARQKLKRKLMHMIDQDLGGQRPSKDTQFAGRITAMLNATRDGNVNVVSELVAQDPALAQAAGLEWSALWHGEVPALHVAVMYQRKDIIDLLLANGADINARDPQHGWSVINQAIDLSFLPDYDSAGMVDFLVARGAKKGLFEYLFADDLEGVKAFLDADPEAINRPGFMGLTPICFGGLAITKLLLERGADVFAALPVEDGRKTFGLNTPLRFIAHLDHIRPGTLRFLLEQAQVPLDIFLHAALGDAASVATWLQTDPELVYARTPSNHTLMPSLTPLHVAAHYGRVEVAQLLLDHGADVNARAPAFKNMTPLHIATWRGRRDKVTVLPDVPKLLCERGADFAARDNDLNLTPLGWATAELEDEQDRGQVAAVLRTFNKMSDV